MQKIWAIATSQKYFISRRRYLD